MYLFVFFWTPALKTAAAAQLNGSAELPLGMIFAAFMASVMLGPLLFNNLISSQRLLSPARLLTIIFATASSSLLIPSVSTSETITFWSFCVFEMCVGMYWPSVGYERTDCGGWDQGQGLWHATDTFERFRSCGTWISAGGRGISECGLHGL
jgi:hypothetical protein